MNTLYRITHGRRNRWGMVVEVINVIEKSTKDRVLRIEFHEPEGRMLLDTNRRKRNK